MALSLLAKSALGSLGVVATCISGWSIYSIMETKTIGDILFTENIKLLENDSDKWEKLVSKHESIKSQSSQNPKLIQGLELGTEDTSKKQLTLKNKCHELWKTEKTHSDATRIKQEIKDWCSSDPQALKES